MFLNLYAFCILSLYGNYFFYVGCHFCDNQEEEDEEEEEGVCPASTSLAQHTAKLLLILLIFFCLYIFFFPSFERVGGKAKREDTHYKAALPTSALSDPDLHCPSVKASSILTLLPVDVLESRSSYTDKETKLLYWEMFRFRISEHGPSTRSNLARSNFTHLRGPRATTVAARGRSRRRAISPK